MGEDPWNGEDLPAPKVIHPAGPAAMSVVLPAANVDSAAVLRATRIDPPVPTTVAVAPVPVAMATPPALAAAVAPAPAAIATPPLAAAAEAPAPLAIAMLPPAKNSLHSGRGEKETHWRWLMHPYRPPQLRFRC
ncbi:hypothetical protein ENBRE01_3392 [Enteropsectra breve]|nr:hypothetical protein ENBRE01_3392 [Enteropsectra breve]